MTKAFDKIAAGLADATAYAKGNKTKGLVAETKILSPFVPSEVEGPVRAKPRTLRANTSRLRAGRTVLGLVQN